MDGLEISKKFFWAARKATRSQARLTMKTCVIRKTSNTPMAEVSETVECSAR